MKNKRYLGDGLYAEWNGFHIILKANDEQRPTDIVYLEPEVMNNLEKFYQDIIKNTKVDKQE